MVCAAKSAMKPRATSLGGGDARGITDGRPCQHECTAGAPTRESIKLSTLPPALRGSRARIATARAAPKKAAPLLPLLVLAIACTPVAAVSAARRHGQILTTGAATASDVARQARDLEAASKAAQACFGAVHAGSFARCVCSDSPLA